MSKLSLVSAICIFFLIGLKYLKNNILDLLDIVSALFHVL